MTTNHHHDPLGRWRATLVGLLLFPGCAATDPPPADGTIDAAAADLPRAPDATADLGATAPDIPTVTPDDAPRMDAARDAGRLDVPADAGATLDVRAADVARDATRPDPVRGFAGNYSSPSIVRVGATYHAYFAAQSLGGRRYHTPHATFTADGDFEFVGEALPHLGARAEEDGAVWAPGVARIDPDHWMLYYTGHLLGTPEKKCLWRARSATPHGPFVDDFDGPMFCADGSLWAIDAYPVEDARGTWHLSARVDRPGGINTIQIRELGALGQHFASGSRWLELTHNAPTWWEQPVMENAGIVRLAPPSGEPHWFVFYTGGSWQDNRYGVGYADCGAGLSDGACTRVTTAGPWLGTDPGEGVYGPGTPTFYTDVADRVMMGVQAWQHSGGTSNPRNRGQIMRTYRVSVDNAYRPTATLVRVDLQP